MTDSSREAQFQKLFPAQPAFRFRQAWPALFNPAIDGWLEVSVWPKAMREICGRDIPWTSLTPVKILTNQKRDTFKAALQTTDGKLIETVLMNNQRGHLTVCLSAQIGCSIGCRFCATGTLGQIRNLSADEIIDQFRFWQKYVFSELNNAGLISNVVLMGMGEPLLNYENVKTALIGLLAHTDLGETRVTVSTVGIFPMLDNLLLDSQWPNVRLAISLHAPDYATRKKIIPTTPPDFFPKLTAWAKKYLAAFGNRRHHLSLEYILINDFNDSIDQAKSLAKLAKTIGAVKINLIPCNAAGRGEFQPSLPAHARAFQNTLNAAGIIATVRQSMGSDIAAACGQLVAKMK